MKILLVDDDVGLISMLAEYLAGEGFETAFAHNGEAAVDMALSGDYAAMILDIMLPGIDGIEVLRRVRRISRLPIIMLTAKGDDIERVIGLEMGADDYVPKPCYPRELVARLRAVLRRAGGGETLSVAEADRDGEVLTCGDLRLFPSLRKVVHGNMTLDLTVSEFNMLELLLRAGKHVLSKDDLSRRVLGRPHAAYDRSIDVHMSNLRQKLAAGHTGDAGLRAVLIETVRGVGYRLISGQEPCS